MQSKRILNIYKMEDQRYLNSEDEFLEYSYLALKDRFLSKKEFTEFYSLIKNNKRKKIFLKTASFYLFLVKRGDWIVDIVGSDPKIDYLTETYKYIGIFSLIESLNENNFIDFYEYLIRHETKTEFPINDKIKLEKLYRNYKEEFGAIQQSVSFFKTLSNEKQNSLISKLEIKKEVTQSGEFEKTELSIENLSKYLYLLRSKFVHEADLILNMSEGTNIGSSNNQIVICKLSILDLMLFFEEGLINHFDNRNK